MTQDLVMVPYSPGEVLDLAAAATDELAARRDEIREVRDALNEFARTLDSELCRRTDAALLAGEADGYTHRIGGWEIRVPSPAPAEQVDAAALRRELLDRGGELGLTAEAVGRCFAATVTYKLKRAPFKALQAQAPALSDVVAAHTTMVPKERRVAVSRLPEVRA